MAESYSTAHSASAPTASKQAAVHMLSSVGAALNLPAAWGDGAGLDGLDALRRDLARDEAIVRWLRERHAAGQPCAWIRPEVLLSINPGRPLPGLHGDRQLTNRLHEMAVWHGKAARGERPAHPFAVAESAVRRAASGENVAICVMGESGSGKTEAAKLVLLHVLNMPSDVVESYADADAIATAAGASAHRALALGVLLSRAVLEAFTHAATPSNGNSSRLVLATRLWVSSDAGLLIGARFQPVMVQTTRAGMPPMAGHGNFHILHSVAASASAAELGGLEPSTLRLLGGHHGPSRVRPGPSFDELAAALAALGMRTRSVSRLREVLLGLVLLGELEPLQLTAAGRGGDGAAALAPPPLEGAALRVARRCEQLLGCGCAVSDLIPSDLPPGISPGGEGSGGGASQLPSVREAELARARSALISHGYELVVGSLLRWINHALLVIGTQHLASLGSTQHLASLGSTQHLAGGTAAPLLEPVAGSVSVVDTPGLEGMATGAASVGGVPDLPITSDARSVGVAAAARLSPLPPAAAVPSHPSYAALVSNYTAERLRATLLHMLLPPARPHTSSDEAIAAALRGDATDAASADAAGAPSLASAIEAALRVLHSDTQDAPSAAHYLKLAARADAIFSAVDRDGSGDISTKELRPALSQLGLNTSSAQTAALMARYDADGEGTLDRAEFLALVRSAELEEVPRPATRLGPVSPHPSPLPPRG